jgi:hypothetical protein
VSCFESVSNAEDDLEFKDGDLLHTTEHVDGQTPTRVAGDAPVCNGRTAQKNDFEANSAAFTKGAG